MKGVGGKYLETGNEIQAKNTSCAEVYFKKNQTQQYLRNSLWSNGSILHKQQRVRC